MNEIETDKLVASHDAGTLYDRVARFYDVTFKFNGYSRSIERYFESHPLRISAGAKILDAGSGTGLLSLALLKTLRRPAEITAVDLSLSSLVTARKAINQEISQAPIKGHKVSLTQANILALPFADHSFDVVVTSGALEYVSLREGFAEASRILSPGGYLFHLPVVPSPASKVLELLFRFKAHSPAEVTAATERHFRVLHEYHFPFPDPIGWTKVAVLSQKL
ncbi:MAG TPA: methyltransferase domain-containing protein [Pyrinomonadaceae bacterium]|nr:methyltransferase domain-containing protein [Pyrinomonadaceae bacterium]